MKYFITQQTIITSCNIFFFSFAKKKNEEKLEEKKGMRALSNCYFSSKKKKRIKMRIIKLDFFNIVIYEFITIIIDSLECNCRQLCFVGIFFNFQFNGACILSFLIENELEKSVLS